MSHVPYSVACVIVSSGPCVACVIVSSGPYSVAWAIQCRKGHNVAWVIVSNGPYSIAWVYSVARGIKGVAVSHQPYCVALIIVSHRPYSRKSRRSDQVIQRGREERSSHDGGSHGMGSRFVG